MDTEDRLKLLEAALLRIEKDLTLSRRNDVDLTAEMGAHKAALRELAEACGRDPQGIIEQVESRKAEYLQMLLEAAEDVDPALGARLDHRNDL